ncbi:MAG: hypothetical protein WD904_04375 [Dehalococcoidia bacterium]
MRKIVFLVVAIVVALIVLYLLSAGTDVQFSDTFTETSPVRIDPTATPGVTLLSQRDEEDINSLVSDVMNRAFIPSERLLRPLIDDRIEDDQLSSFVGCAPVGAGIELDDPAEITPGRDGEAVVRGQFVARAGANVKTVAYEWGVARQDDGSWLLTEVPECPF